MNNRRRLVIALGTTASMPQLVFAHAKTPRVVIIGWLHTGWRTAGSHYLDAFKEGMTALGRKDGVTYVVEERWAEGRLERIESLLGEIAAKKPQIFVVFGTAPSQVAAAKWPTTPVVQVAGRFLGSSHVKSLARPGGMVTGLDNLAYDLAEKRLELLLDAVPGLKRVGFLIETVPATFKRAMDAARRSIARFPVDARFGEVAKPEEIEAALARLASDEIQALIVMPGAFVPSARDRIIPFALAQRWPVVVGHTEWADAGALLSYGADLPALYRRAAHFVDRILRGANPGDLPVEQPTTFELAVNLKTAKTLNITMPPTIMVQATRVIQ